MIKKQEIYHMSTDWLRNLTKHAEMHAQDLLLDYQKGENRFLTEIDETINVEAMKALAEKWKGFNLIIVGIGGSILSPSLFFPFAKTNNRIDFLTVPDEVPISKLLNSIDIDKTRFVFLSKSGQTIETVAIFLHILSWAKEKSLNVSDIMVAVCENNENPIKNLCKLNNIECFYTDKDINSRFSLWTPIGILPNYLFGLDGTEIRLGAKEYIQGFLNAVKNKQHHKLFTSAAYSFIGQQQNKNIQVMIYSDKRLKPLALWWQQLFAESLGKNNKATTPICVSLPEDLHIRFQLYLDGANDKIFTILKMPQQPNKTPIKTYDIEGLKYIEGSVLNDIIIGQENNAETTLLRARRIMRTLTLDDFSEKNYGALCAHFALEILLIAKMWDVQAFGQPAIEKGKKNLENFLSNKKI